MSENFNLLKEIKYLERFLAILLEEREKSLASGKRELEAVTNLVAERQNTVIETKVRLAQLRDAIIELNSMPKTVSVPQDLINNSVTKESKMPNPDKRPSCANLILVFLEENPGATSAEIVAAFTDMKKDTVQWTIGNLVKKGLVLREGKAHRKA